MTPFEQFLATFGSVMVLLCLVAAWQFRMAAVHVAWRLLFPLAIVAFALWTPFKVIWMLGFPVATDMRDMPARAELVQFYPRDEIKKVDLWLLAPGEPTPRAYEIALTPALQKLLSQAREGLARGELVGLETKGSAKDDGKDRVNAYDQSVMQVGTPEYEMVPGGTRVVPPKDR